MLYPLFFNPIYKSTIWGGRNLEKIFNRKIPDGNIAESWEICCHGEDDSVVSNGFLKDKKLSELIEMYGFKLLGNNCRGFNKFPLLIKFIDAKDKLSVQVHPTDEYALKYEGESGKTEAWYVVNGKKGAQLIYGTKKDINKGDFLNSLYSGNIEECLRFVDIKNGDFVFIPSGTVHAILDGVLILEIQQNCDLTYRIYDWNRVDKKGNLRPLHIDKALDVIDFNFKGEVIQPAISSFGGYNFSSVINCSYFKIDLVKVSERFEDYSSMDSFFTFTCIQGSGKLIHCNVVYDIPPGCSFMLPAGIGNYEILGEITLIKTHI
ncbi:mannose-6-phosphate isomerase [Fervidicella metallireducens AeB]|uniref:Phosphohexomutase n=1 Tax=Fervidicella metallireducens AeB TaxID=1403537 RepID=A0A017RXL9_9CLOT|nr:type I phosphomannose isomerase catalytic subunit [Fervidicella metallireducens]EYE89427.1 mannose-6-phosphate isomerase [Fervidicella metallireducens AeB]